MQDLPDDLCTAFQISGKNGVRLLFVGGIQQEGARANLKRIIAVDLCQAIEVHDIIVPDLRMQRAVHAPVLADITVVAVALREILTGD